MKQLQNNFTSPEQSKKLLEIGLPIYEENANILNFSKLED